MPVHGIAQLDRLADRLDALLADLGTDSAPVGTAAAEAIVRTTLDGVGAGDRPFAPYSPGYAKRAAAAGKPTTPVNLRGIVRPTGTAARGAKGPPPAKPTRSTTFHTVTPTPRPPANPGRPPATGLVDRDSELSLDLIRVTAAANAVELVYTPRRDGHMILQQTGTATLPPRPWFTLDKSAVRAAAVAAARAVLAGRVQRFRDGR